MSLIPTGFDQVWPPTDRADEPAVRRAPADVVRSEVDPVAVGALRRRIRGHDAIRFTLFNSITQPADVAGPRKRSPDLRFVTFSGAGHFPVLADPGGFVPFLRAAIARTAGPL